MDDPQKSLVFELNPPVVLRHLPSGPVTASDARIGDESCLPLHSDFEGFRGRADRVHSIPEATRELVR